MLTPLLADQTFASFAGELPLPALRHWIALLTGVCALAAVVWGAVMRATKPLRDRLDEIHGIAEGLAAERERVDDLDDRVAGLERRLSSIERRIEDLYHLILTLIDPRRMRQDHHTPLEVEDDQQSR